MKDIIERIKNNKKNVLRVSGVVVTILFALFLASLPNVTDKTYETQDDGNGTGVYTIKRERWKTKVEVYLSENFDSFNIDGSTTMIPLHQSLNDKFSSEVITVDHSRTVDAFELFINGEVDILLGVDYSQELLDKAKKNGIDLVKLEITKEAFVFLIHKDNPVKSLTVEQIIDIYSGRITNWKTVGGPNEKIVPFQRNNDSGSQIQMVLLMGNRKLIQKGVYYYEGMLDIIKAIANYDKGIYSLAYNMYTFSEKQYKNEDVELLAINGVVPTDETIQDGTYPLIIYNYIYYDQNNESVSEFAMNLYNYLVSVGGQQQIANEGYITLDSGYIRNPDVEIPDDNYYYYNFYEEESISYYNKEKGEFYRVGESGKLIVYYNYADYVLADSAYINDENARKFLMSIFHSGLSLTDSLTHIWVNSEDGTIVLSRGHPYDIDPFAFFNIRFNGKYYEELHYYIEEDKYVLTSVSKKAVDVFLDDDFLVVSPYSKDSIATSDLEISVYDIYELYFRVLSWEEESFEEIPYFQIYD